MNIAYIVPSLANKGPVVVVYELVKQMIQYGHQCTVFYFDDDLGIQFDCPVQRISFFKKYSFVDFDIVHSHGLRPDCYVFFHKYSHHSQPKYLSTLHNYMFKDLSYQYNSVIAFIGSILWILILARHDKIIVLSNNAMKYYSRWIKSRRLTYIYNSRNLVLKDLSQDIKEELFKFKDGYRLIGINAMLTHRKGIDLLIKALVFLPEYKLFIVGTGNELGKLRFLARKFGVVNRIYFAGYRYDAYLYLQYYDLFAMPSRSEGFPLALLEAAAMKCPVVCSDIQIFKEICSDEVAFFHLEDIPSLVSAIRLAVNNSDMTKRMYQTFSKKYSIEIFGKKYLEAYESELRAGCCLYVF